MLYLLMLLHFVYVMLAHAGTFCICNACSCWYILYMLCLLMLLYFVYVMLAYAASFCICFACSCFFIIYMLCLLVLLRSVYAIYTRQILPSSDKQCRKIGGLFVFLMCSLVHHIQFTERERQRATW